MADDTVDPLANVRNAKYRHFRAMDPAHPFPSPLEPGEIAVNTANMQIAVGDADITTEGVPLQLIAVRYWNSRSQYDTGGDFVVMGGGIRSPLSRSAARTGFDPAPMAQRPGQDRCVSAAPTDGEAAMAYRITASFSVWIETDRSALATVCLGISTQDDQPSVGSSRSAVPKSGLGRNSNRVFLLLVNSACNVLSHPVTISMAPIPAGLVGTLGLYQT